MSELSDDELRDLVLNANRAFYIQLGSGSYLARRCIEGGCIMVGYPKVPHDDIIKNPALASSPATLRRFYNEKGAIWVTAWNMRLWWTFATDEFDTTKDDMGAELKIRGATGWRCKSLCGRTLYLHSIGGVLGLKGRGANVAKQIHGSVKNDGKPFSYLRNLILGADTLSHTDCESKRVGVMISRLNGEQTEQFVDMLFCEMGWARISPLGGSQKDIDMVAKYQETKTPHFVQIKAKASLSDWGVFVRAIGDFCQVKNNGEHNAEFHFVYHTPDDDGYCCDDLRDDLRRWFKTPLSRRLGGFLGKTFEHSHRELEQEVQDYLDRVEKERNRLRGDVDSDEYKKARDRYAAAKGRYEIVLETFEAMDSINKNPNVNVRVWSRKCLVKEVMAFKDQGRKDLYEWLEGLVGWREKEEEAS